jgi:uncharacterized protein
VTLGTGDLRVLDGDRCLELLGEVAYIRVAFVRGSMPAVMPVSHLLLDGAIYFRTEPSSQLSAAAVHGLVTVQADWAEARTRRGWSVVAHGRASFVGDARELERLEAQRFEPWVLPEADGCWVRIDVHEVSGGEIASPRR